MHQETFCFVEVTQSFSSVVNRLENERCLCLIVDRVEHKLERLDTRKKSSNLIQIVKTGLFIPKSFKTLFIELIRIN
ncbi:MAG: hypothetical protein J07HX64_02780 [halophilic archaeon J07HX64]|nr:MAG: hypothetical protein J07HX64_02780 [halophilic archaeon J07HX64]